MKEHRVKLPPTLRQLAFPSEFRIAAPVWPDETLAVLLDAAEMIDIGQTSNSPKTVDARLLAELSTGLWRMQQKMLKPGSEQPLDEMRRPYRHLETVWDILTQAGIEVHNHTGERTPQGGAYSLKVLAFQPTPGITHNTVIETIKPSIFYQSQLVQMGEVIIGTPENSGEAPDKTPHGGYPAHRDN